ncbi:MAG: 3-deoxy-manno-octulosonate cytidylyltransferase [Alphaproteobacteria bacterium]|nr:3-deoxy-manno-octulosonate cytidylyltransferase [Alphaproteobacteria bacterium]
MRPQRPLVVIPARMAAQRLPGKPLADIGGEPMIVHVWRRATAADVGPVVVAAGDREIAEAIEKAGGRALLTRPDHNTGSDRVYEAFSALGGGSAFDAIINLQGDLPLIDPDAIRAVLGPLAEPAVDIATLVALTDDATEAADPNVVKAIVSVAPGARSGRALYFTRATAPSGPGPLLHHIGIYAYRPAALARFVALPQSPLERRERLEQLRALEAGMRIDAALVDTVPFGVDTPADLDKARRLFAASRTAPRG